MRTYAVVMTFVVAMLASSDSWAGLRYRGESCDGENRCESGTVCNKGYCEFPIMFPERKACKDAFIQKGMNPAEPVYLAGPFCYNTKECPYIRIDYFAALEKIDGKKSKVVDSLGAFAEVVSDPVSAAKDESRSVRFRFDPAKPDDVSWAKRGTLRSAVEYAIDADLYSEMRNYFPELPKQEDLPEPPEKHLFGIIRSPENDARAVAFYKAIDAIVTPLAELPGTVIAADKFASQIGKDKMEADAAMARVKAKCSACKYCRLE